MRRGGSIRREQSATFSCLPGPILRMILPPTFKRVSAVSRSHASLPTVPTIDVTVTIVLIQQRKTVKNVLCERLSHNEC